MVAGILSTVELVASRPYPYDFSYWDYVERYGKRKKRNQHSLSPPLLYTANPRRRRRDIARISLGHIEESSSIALTRRRKATIEVLFDDYLGVGGEYTHKGELEALVPGPWKQAAL